jgi:hypothetical protein
MPLPSPVSPHPRPASARTACARGRAACEHVFARQHRAIGDRRIHGSGSPSALSPRLAQLLTVQRLAQARSQSMGESSRTRQDAALLVAVERLEAILQRLRLAPADRLLQRAAGRLRSIPSSLHPPSPPAGDAGSDPAQLRTMVIIQVGRGSGASGRPRGANPHELSCNTSWAGLPPQEAQGDGVELGRTQAVETGKGGLRPRAQSASSSVSGERGRLSSRGTVVECSQAAACLSISRLSATPCGCTVWAPQAADHAPIRPRTRIWVRDYQTFPNIQRPQRTTMLSNAALPSPSYPPDAECLYHSPTSRRRFISAWAVRRPLRRW